MSLALADLISGDVIDQHGNQGVALFRAPDWWLENRAAGLPITALEAKVLDIELESFTPVSEMFFSVKAS